MTVPLAVKLTLPDGDERMITRQLSDLKFSSKQRGGYSTCSAPLARALNLPAIPEGSRLTVYDTRNGKVVWDGRVLTPGRGVSLSGQVASLSAIGEGPASTKDQTIPYMVVDSSLSSWEQQTSSRTGMSVRTGSSPNSEEPGLTFSARGDVAAGDRTIAWYRNLHRCRQLIGAIAFSHIEGENLSDRALDLRIGTSPEAVSVTLFTYPWSTGLAERFVALTPELWLNASTLKFGWRFAGTGTVADTTWSTIRAVSVYARLLGRDRQPRPPSIYTTAQWVKIEDVFTDVIARFCPRLDIENAKIALGSFNFTQLVWTSGITAAQVLDEVLDMEPSMTWAVWERQANGRYRTELRVLPTEVRYEASPVDGWSSPNPTSELYNRVIVLWKNSIGDEQSTVVTGPCPLLDAAGLERTATIDLGSEQGTEAQAIARGNAFLADHQVPPSGGQLTVSRPIRDLIEGRYVMPWEIKPAELVRVVGVHSQPDALNANSADGVTTARIAEMSYAQSSESAVLDLDVPAMNLQRQVVQMANARSRR